MKEPTNQQLTIRLRKLKASVQERTHGIIWGRRQCTETEKYLPSILLTDDYYV